MNHARRQGRTVEEDAIHVNTSVVIMMEMVNIALACEEAFMHCGMSKENR